MSNSPQKRHGEQNAGGNTPGPRRKKQSADKVPDALSIATIAAQFIPPGAWDFQDLRMASEAVKLASRIMEEASKQTTIRAYTLFDSEAELNMRDIAETFREHGWAKLQSHNTVAKLVLELFDAMHRDIQYRRALLATAFRNKSTRIDPEEAESEARRGIKDLLQSLGMNFLVAHRIDDLVNHVWLDLVDEWLIGERHLKKELAKLECASATLFSEICVDSSYEDYAIAQKYPKALAENELLAVVLWMKVRLRRELENVETREGVMAKIVALNQWPGLLYPGERHISKPLAECISYLKDHEVEQETLLKKFDQGIDKFSQFLGCSMLIDFSREFHTEQLLFCLKQIKSDWDNAREEDKEQLSEFFDDEPPLEIKWISSSSWDTVPFYPMGMPYDGRDVKSPILYPYAKRLDRLLHSLGNCEYLASSLFCHAGVTQGLQRAESVVRSEKARIIQMSEELQDDKTETYQRRISLGEKLTEPLGSEFKPGKIKVHLLFRYAAERGLMEDRLVKA